MLKNHIVITSNKMIALMIDTFPLFYNAGLFKTNYFVSLKGSYTQHKIKMTFVEKSLKESEGNYFHSYI